MTAPDLNPYAAPLAMDDLANGMHPDQQVRLNHLECEKNIQSVGSLMVIGAILSGLGFTYMVVDMLDGNVSPFPAGSGVLIFGILCPLHLTTAIGLNRLRSWGRGWGIFISVLWLLAIPIGTIIAAAALWSLGRPKAAFVFSDEYRAIIDRTPQIRLRTSAASFAAAGLLLLTVIGVIFLISFYG